MEPITGISSDPEHKLTVQKSRPLFALWRSGLTLAEFKILDTYLSRIDSRNPDKRVVLFEKGELEQLLGVKKINNAELQERLTHLMSNVVKVDDPTKTKSYRLISLFEEAVAEQDENGLWEVRLECTQKAMKYFFNIDNLGYLRYKLRCITSITSRYSYILFIYLEANRFRKSWDVDLDELKAILCCDQEETYKAFKRFNDLLLKRCQKELHEKTECRFTYEPIKKGRSVVSVRFTMESIALPSTVAPIDENQISLEGFDDVDTLLSEACNNEFNSLEIAEIKAILFPVQLTHPDGVNVARFHLLARVYAALNTANEKSFRTKNKSIVHRFGYFKKLLLAEIEKIQAE